MSTNAMVGVEMADGSVKGIRVHWDGYPKWCGAILLQHYQTEALALALLELGDMSCIAPTIGEKHDFRNYDTSMCKRLWPRPRRDRHGGADVQQPPQLQAPRERRRFLVSHVQRALAHHGRLNLPCVEALGVRT